MRQDPQSDAFRFFEIGGWFDQRFGPKAGRRYPTMKSALGLFLQWGGQSIVETGTQRQENDWGAGCSTLIFAETLHHHQRGHLWSVDISAANIAVSRRVTAHVGERVTHVVSDSLAWLGGFEKGIDLLYLDSYDWEPNEPQLGECQRHQLAELRAAWPRLGDKSIVLLDDNNLAGGGKTQLAKEFLLVQGWTCVLDFEQSLWIP